MFLRFTDEHGPPTPKFGGHPRAFGALFRPEIHGTQQLDTESQVRNHKIRPFVVINQ